MRQQGGGGGGGERFRYVQARCVWWLVPWEPLVEWLTFKLCWLGSN